MPGTNEIGLGVWQLDDVEGIVGAGLDLGYRLIDTASAYGNEAEVGRAIAASSVARSDIHVVTKVWLSDFERVPQALDESRARLGLDTIDTVLLHWPVPMQFDRTVRAFEALLASDAVEHSGVSNFTQQHLDELTARTGVVPAVNQIEVHPYFGQSALRELHAARGIRTQAHSPLGGQAASGPRPIDHDLVADIARDAEATPGQVVLAWHRQHGVTALPRASSPARLAENLASLSLVLTPAQLARLDALDHGARLGPDPALVHDTYFG